MLTLAPLITPATRRLPEPVELTVTAPEELVELVLLFA